jgi:hypothetical protein
VHTRGLYIGKYLPLGGGKNISRCHLGEKKKYEKAKRKRGKMQRKKTERGKKNEERGKKVRKLVK